MPRIKTLKPGVRTLDQRTARNPPGQKRLRGDSLYAVMKRLVREKPRMCAACYATGRVTIGEELDHIVPLWQGGSNEAGNLQWLCRPCHREKTAREARERTGGG